MELNLRWDGDELRSGFEVIGRKTTKPDGNLLYYSPTTGFSRNKESFEGNFKKLKWVDIGIFGKILTSQNGTTIGRVVKNELGDFDVLTATRGFGEPKLFTSISMEDAQNKLELHFGVAK